MANISKYLADVMIDKLLRNQVFTPPATVYLALFTAVTGLDDDNPTAEVQTPGANGYARAAMALDAGVDGVSANTDIEDFTASGSGWSAVTHCAIVDHATAVDWGTGVHVLMWGALDVAKTAGVGDTIRFIAGALDITIT
jgi:hypothetical protein